MKTKVFERQPGGSLRIRGYNIEEYPPKELAVKEIKELIEISERVF